MEGVVLMDHQERIVLANKAFEKNAGDFEKFSHGKESLRLELDHTEIPKASGKLSLATCHA